MNYLERALDSITEDILENEHPAYSLHDILDSTLILGDEISKVFRAHKERDFTECRRVDFFYACEKAVREYVRVNLAAEISELASELEQDAIAEAAEARADVRAA